MDAYETLLSPLWWATVLLATLLIDAACRWLARRHRNSPEQRAQRSAGTPRPLRFGPWVIGLTVLGNIALLGGLAAANLRTPRPAGPIGLSCVVCALVSVILAFSLHSADRGRGDR